MPTERSGSFSSDPVFDPGELFEVVEREENAHRALDAMREFVRRGDGPMFERAVAVYVRSARARREPVETVLATLETLADEVQRASPGYAERQTPLRNRVLRGVLLAFYGADIVRREADARVDRTERRRGERNQL